MMTRQAINKNGPYGMTLSLLLKYRINERGKAMKLDKKIVNKDIHGPTAHPTKNINLMSPPPNDSFLKMKFPKSINTYIKKKAPIPNNKYIKASFGPFMMNLTKMMTTEKKNVTSSGMIK